MDYQKIYAYVTTSFSVLFYYTLSLPFFKVLCCKLNFEFTPIALIGTIYADAITWFLYADKIFCDQLKLNSLIGGCCSLSLILIYLAFQLKKYLLDSFLNFIILILGTSALYRGLNIIIEDAQLIGKIAIGTKIITFFSPISIIFIVMKEKNYKLISVNITLTYFCYCIAWCWFGKVINDINIMIANGIGAVLCFIQFIVYLNFKKKYSYYDGSSYTIGIERSSNEDVKKDGSTTMSIDEEKQDRAKEKSIKIVTRIIDK